MSETRTPDATTRATLVARLVRHAHDLTNGGTNATFLMRDLNLAADALAALPEARTWQPIETAPTGKSILIRVPTSNAPNSKAVTVKGFFAPAGTQELDCDDGDSVDEAGCNMVDAWFEESAEREPYAMMLTYTPTHWMPLPDPPASAPREEE